MFGFVEQWLRNRVIFLLVGLTRVPHEVKLRNWGFVLGHFAVNVVKLFGMCCMIFLLRGS